MEKLKLYNTLTRQKEEFKPLGKTVKLYTCGPTVYDYAHIGNLRTFIFYDVLERTLEFLGYTVNRAMNITDVGHLTSDTDDGEDKMDKAVARENASVEKLIERYTNVFIEDAEKLNIKIPSKLPRASAHIPEQKQLIQTLFEKGYAYDTPEAVYFDTSKFKGYGKLTGQTLEEKLVGARDAVVTKTSKRHPADFALWFKLVGRFEHHVQQWNSPWGKGFPGWHLECSALIKTLLGQPIDIHTGGVDHIGTHHTNEIAQSEAAYGVPLANVWMHGEFLLVDGGKMAKSAGSFYTLKDIEARGINPLTFRYLMLSAHYRSKINFTWQSLEAAQNALGNLYAEIAALRTSADTKESAITNDAEEKFAAALEDDLNTPEALATLHATIKNACLSPQQKLDAVALFERVLGLGLNAIQKESKIPSEIQKLLDRYNEFRTNKQFVQSDELREKLHALGYSVQDNSDGSSVIRKTRI